MQFLFWSALAVWTWLLLKPNPFPEIARLLSSWADLLEFLAAKTVHVSAYAAFTVLAVASGRRWLLPIVLLHGPLSELGQYFGNRWFDTGRGGCVRDVFIDWTGVAAGYGFWVMCQRYRAKRVTETGGVEPVRPSIGSSGTPAGEVIREM